MKSESVKLSDGHWSLKKTWCEGKSVSSSLAFIKKSSLSIRYFVYYNVMIILEAVKNVNIQSI